MQQPYIREGFGSNSYDNLTLIHPLGLAALLVGVVWTLVAARRTAWLPILLLACFVPTSQRIVVATLDFNLIRILVAVGMFRILQRGEYKGGRITGLDRAVFLWIMASMVIHVARVGSTSALVFKLGGAYDTLGLYIIARVWLRSTSDLIRLSRYAAIIACISVVGFTVEHFTGRNGFSIFGGVPEITYVRDGRLRCQGPFAHPILAGTFWIAFLPLVTAQYLTQRGAPLQLAGALCISAIVVFCSSSTPVLGGIASVVFGLLWLARDRVRLLCWATLALTAGLHVIMEAPVWHLIARMSVVGGSTGFHRFNLIDAFINRWPEWFLLGTNSTAHWGWFLFDVTNQFVKEGVRGGILGLLLFLLVLRRAFAGIGQRAASSIDKKQAMLMWAIGTGIATHCVMFIGISITHSNTNMLIFLWLLAATQVKTVRRKVRRQSFAISR